MSKYNIHYEIKSSENFITPDIELELIAIKNISTIQSIQAEAIWSYNPDIPGISLINNKIYLSSEAQSLNEITIHCTISENNLTLTRTYKVIHTTRKKPLIHFINNNHNYSGADFTWDIWSYENKDKHANIDFTNHSDFGITANAEHSNIIIRKKIWGHNWHNDWADQTIAFKLDMQYDNYYIVYGVNKLYTSITDIILLMNPRILYAVMDDKAEIKAYLSHAPIDATKFKLYINSEIQPNVRYFVHHQEVILNNLPLNIKPSDLLEIRADSTFPPAKVVIRNYLNNFDYLDNDMGVTFLDSKIRLRLWAPTAKRVEVLLYNEWVNQQSHPNHIFVLNRENNTWLTEINRHEFENQNYLYRLYFDDINSVGNKTTTITYALDPYAYAVNINGHCGVLIDINTKDVLPAGFINHSVSKLKHKEDAIIYEMHIRDFTIANNSGVEQDLRGKFLGAAKSETIYADKQKFVATGIDSLVELGITHVHLLPIFDFSSVDETISDDISNRNWGYDPQNYNAPEGSYSLNPDDPKSRIIELRHMIQEFHNKGLSVIIDVVYNHMTNTDNMNAIVPGYYFRSDEFGKYTNGSGCGNELATEKPMVRKFILDSILHWIKDYKIDGIRFDLMELIDLDTMKLIVEKAHLVNPDILIYGEPWSGGDSPLKNRTYRGTQKNNNFSIFNDLLRNAIRGSNYPGQGFINGEQHNAIIGYRIIEGLKGSTTELTSYPGESINYVDAHDNYTLWDHIEKSSDYSITKYRENIPANPFESNLVRQNLLALGLILTAQGIPFIHGGAEMLRTKQGDHNSYKSSDNINAFNWADKLKFKEVFNYVKGLIQLRKAHPAFRMTSKEMIEKHLNIYMAHNEHSGVIISHFHNHANNDSWQDIIVIYNATTIDNYSINSFIPQTNKNNWHVVVNHDKSGIETIAEFKKEDLPSLKSHSILVIHS